MNKNHYDEAQELETDLATVMSGGPSHTRRASRKPTTRGQMARRKARGSSRSKGRTRIATGGMHLRGSKRTRR